MLYAIYIYIYNADVPDVPALSLLSLLFAVYLPRWLLVAGCDYASGQILDNIGKLTMRLRPILSF